MSDLPSSAGRAGAAPDAADPADPTPGPTVGTDVIRGVWIALGVSLAFWAAVAGLVALAWFVSPAVMVLVLLAVGLIVAGWLS